MLIKYKYPEYKEYFIEHILRKYYNISCDENPYYFSNKLFEHFSRKLNKRITSTNSLFESKITVKEFEKQISIELLQNS